ncbi:MAG: DNA-binding protein [Chlamydiales bacterium]
MVKKKTSKKREFRLKDYPTTPLRKGIKLSKFSPKEELSDYNLIASAFFESLKEDDVETALEILEGYLIATKKSALAKKGKIPSSTVYHSLSKGANPTLRTVAKLLHAAS